MSDVSGPIATLPGSLHRLPDGSKCDDHPDRAAVRRVQGETDSFGAEFYDLCQECFDRMRKDSAEFGGRCDWCKSEVDELRHRRDPDEGLYGPVYQVCRPCWQRVVEELYSEDAADPVTAAERALEKRGIAT